MSDDDYQVIFDKAVADLAVRYRQAIVAVKLIAGDPVPCTDDERRQMDEAEAAVNDAYASRYVLGVDERTGRQIVIGIAVTIEAFRHVVGVWWRIQDGCLRRRMNGGVTGEI